MLAIKTETAPTLVAGAFDIVFGQFEKVLAATVSFDNPAANDTVFATDISLSGNTVTVTVKKIDVAGTTPVAWAAAVTTDVADKAFTIVAEGE